MSVSPNVNSSKALSAVLGSPANAANVGNAVNSAKINSTVSAVMANAATNAKSAAMNSINSITNSIKSLNSSIAKPLSASINAVPESSPSLGITLPIILGLGIIIIAITLVVYYFSIIESGAHHAFDKIKNWFHRLTHSDKKPEPPAENPLEYPIQQQGLPDPETDVVNKMLPGSKQVFNVAANKYTYNDAEPLCKALGAELATYDQVKQAWDKGADWCNYGWVKGQAAVYPTQKSTFDELQGGSSDDERLACGEIGVNGGFFDNPELRFGVNCYGDKPSQSSNDLRVTNENAQPPLTPDALNQKKRELAYKAHIDQIGLLPFRANTWSQ